MLKAKISYKSLQKYFPQERLYNFSSHLKM